MAGISQAGIPAKQHRRNSHGFSRCWHLTTQEAIIIYSVHLPKTLTCGQVHELDITRGKIRPYEGD